MSRTNRPRRRPWQARVLKASVLVGKILLLIAAGFALWYLGIAREALRLFRGVGGP